MRKVMLAVAAVGALAAAPTAAMASSGHKAPTKGTTVHVCVSQKKHGLKARVSRKCTQGEKAVTLHLPSGNALSVKDANGNVVGTLVTYWGSEISMMLNDGTIVDVDPATGNIYYAQPDFKYASADCTGPAYVDWGAVQMPFAAPDNSAVGAPLYTVSPSTVPLNVGSVYDATTGCTPTGGSNVDASAHAVNATGATVLANFAGPLTITKR
jgi:hypothetical protein